MGKPFIDHGLGRNFGLGNNLSVYLHAQFPVPMWMMANSGPQDGFLPAEHLELLTENSWNPPLDRMGPGGGLIPKTVETNDSTLSRAIDGKFWGGFLNQFLPDCQIWFFGLSGFMFGLSSK